MYGAFVYLQIGTYDIYADHNPVQCKSNKTDIYPRMYQEQKSKVKSLCATQFGIKKCIFSLLFCDSVVFRFI